MASPYPAASAHRDPRASFFSQHSLVDDFADEESRYSDITGSFEQLNVNDTYRPTANRAMSSFSVSGKDYILLSFKRDGEDWLSAQTEEIVAPQKDLKKFMKKNDGKALAQLEKMAKSRRKHIQDMAAAFTAQDSANAIWEPAFIKTLDERKTLDGKLSVRHFKVIFARNVRNAGPTTRRKSNVSEKVTIKQPNPPKAAKGKDVKFQDEERPRPTRRASALNDPFGANLLFNGHGHPMDTRGPIAFNNAGMPEHIRVERPLGYIPPPPPQQEPLPLPQIGEAGARPNSRPVVVVDEHLAHGGLHAGDPDAVIEVGDDHRGRWGRSASRLREGSRHRRPSSAHRPVERVLPRLSNRFSDHYASSRSSWASDDESAVWGEWDDRSSRTSDDTNSHGRSPVQKSYRTSPPAQRYYRDTRYYRDGRMQIANSHPRRQTIQVRADNVGVEEPLRRRPSVSRPLVHQQAPPSPRQNIPPAVPEVASFSTREREQVQTRHADEYMRNTIREEDARREREFEAGRNTTQEAGYTRKRYTYEPREHQSAYRRAF